MSTKFIDMTSWVMKDHNVPNSRITVIRRDGTCLPVKWICQCECGKIFSTRGTALRNGETLSCGCYIKDKISHLLHIKKEE